MKLEGQLLEKIIEETGAMKRGSGWQGHCPYHNDEHPSLSIRESNNGKVLVKCHAGCTNDSIIDTFRAKGIWPGRDKKTDPKSLQYVYKAESGKLGIRVTRIEFDDGTKSFYQEYFDGTNWRSGGAKKLSENILPFNFDKLKNERDIFLLEGEKKCLRLFAELIPATTILGGSSGWKNHYAKYFKNKNVIILPDNDPPGEKFAQNALQDILPGASSVKIIHLPGLAKSEDAHDWLDKYRHTKEDLLAYVKNAPFSQLAELTGGNKADNEKPIIKVEPGKLHDVATESESALINSRVSIYIHAERLVIPVVDETEASGGARTNVARLTSVTIDSLTDHLSRVINFTKFDARSKKWLGVDPPRNIPSTILSRDGEWKFSKLAGVITAPTLRPDGTILSKVGYDSQTRLLLASSPSMPEIPSYPSKGDAEKALGLLTELVFEFPFLDEESRAVALSAILSSIVRGAMPVVPLHAVTSSTAGSGKSYLFDLVSGIATGYRCPIISAGEKEEETEKRLGSALIAGQQIISIDNANGELGGDFLCLAVERPSFKIRPLGLSKLVHIENRATIFATGNNLALKGDMVRRTVLCGLDPELERPELRQFKKDPLAQILEDRGKYIAAALIIVRAYIEAGCPGTLPALASFGEWSRLVRSALVWLGCSDPCKTIERVRAEDPETSQIHEVVSEWKRSIGEDNPMTTGELIVKAGVTATFLEALNLVSLGNSTVDSRRLGEWLKRNKGRIVNGLKIVGKRDSHAKQMKWSLTSIENKTAGTAGGSGYRVAHDAIDVTDNSNDRVIDLPATTLTTRKTEIGFSRGINVESNQASLSRNADTTGAKASCFLEWRNEK